MNYKKMDDSGLTNEMDVYHIISEAHTLSLSKNFVVKSMKSTYGEDWVNIGRNLLNNMNPELATPEIKEAFEKYAQ